MLRFVALGILIGCCVIGAAHGGGGGIFRYKDCPRPSYSPLHYWAPSAYRVAGMVSSKGDYTFPHAYGYAPTHVVKFRCPAVDPFHRYMDTGLPYDLNGPFAPLAPVPPSEPPKY